MRVRFPPLASTGSNPTTTGTALLTLTISALYVQRACGIHPEVKGPDRIADLVAHLGRRPADDEPIPLATWWALPTTSVEDRWWSLRAVAPTSLARILGVRAACLAARRALPAYEARFPHWRPTRASAVIEAIKAAEAWVADPTTERVEACRVASDKVVDTAAYGIAYVAAAAADVVYAIYAAADAAETIGSRTVAGTVAYNAEMRAQCADLDLLLSELRAIQD